MVSRIDRLENYGMLPCCILTITMKQKSMQRVSVARVWKNRGNWFGKAAHTAYFFLFIILLASHDTDVAYVCVAIVAAGILPGLFRRVRCRYPTLAINVFGRIPGIYGLIAIGRRITYYQPKPLNFPPFWHFPALGPFLLTVAFCIGTFLYCLCVQPWYRLNREWGSPPLAIRAGMIANGLFPILFALSTKVNIVTMLTAISHERLQVSCCDPFQSYN